MMNNPVILDQNNEAIIYLCKRDKKIEKVIKKIGTISYMPYEDDSYAFLVHEIIEQMLSIKAGAKIYQRLNDLCEGKSHLKE